MTAASPHTHSFVKACLISLSISLNFVVSENAIESQNNSIVRSASAPPAGEKHAGLRELPSIVRVQRTTSGCPDKATSFSRIRREGCSARVAHRRRRNDYGGGGAPRSICLHLTAQQRRCRAPHLPWKSAYQLRTHGEGGYPGGGTQWNVFHPPHSRRAAIVREGLGSVVTTRTDHRKTEGNAITLMPFSYLSTLRVVGGRPPLSGIVRKWSGSPRASYQKRATIGGALAPSAARFAETAPTPRALSERRRRWRGYIRAVIALIRKSSPSWRRFWFTKIQII